MLTNIQLKLLKEALAREKLEGKNTIYRWDTDGEDRHLNTPAAQDLIDMGYAHQSILVYGFILTDQGRKTAEELTTS